MLYIPNWVFKHLNAFWWIVVVALFTGVLVGILIRNEVR